MHRPSLSQACSNENSTRKGPEMCKRVTGMARKADRLTLKSGKHSTIMWTLSVISGSILQVFAVEHVSWHYNLTNVSYGSDYAGSIHPGQGPFSLSYAAACSRNTA